jgi:hypothetical protein
MSQKLTVDFPESRVVQIWQDCPGRTDLETEEDGPVRVIYPGRVNDDRGADFRDAVIETGRGLLTGDIEIHVRSSYWHLHRHHRDPLYNRVILHVVYRNDMARSGLLENGHRVPTVALESLSLPSEGHPPLERLPLPCWRAAGMREEEAFLSIIERAGDQRFESRAAGFQTVSSRVEAGQVLYRGIMAALGYTRNKHQMTALAGRVPLRRLETMVTALTPAKECLARYQAILIGTAGLLPSQCSPHRRDDTTTPWRERLEKIWAATGERAAMSEQDWHFFRVRPGNYPVQRLAAIARLLLRYREEGLLAGLVRESNRAALKGGHRELEEALTISAGGDEENNLGHSRSFNRCVPALLGRERAAVIVINVLLPFTVAWNRVNSLPELSEKVADLYRRYPAPGRNTLEKHMSRQLGLDERVVNTARRQQGLLHIYKAFCAVGGCQRCPVSQVS